MNRLALALTMALAAPAAIAQCTIRSTGSQIVPTPIDSWTAIQPIGFAFPFNGTTYTDCYISDHGLVALSNAGVPASPPGGGFTYTVTSASLVTNAPLISAYWSDHNTPGGIFVDNTSGTSCTITWLNAQTYNGQLPAFTSQVKLYLNGRVEVLLDHHVDNRGSAFDLNAVVGMGAGTPAVLPAGSDLSAGVSTLDGSVFEQFTTTAPGTPNPNFDLAGRLIRFTPTSPGWNVATSPLPSIGALGTQIAPTPVDSWTTIQPIGFAFPYNGTTYTDCYISDHGIVSLSNAGVPAVPPTGSFTYTVTSASLVANAPLIAAYWSDQNAPGGIFIDNTSATSCTITWSNAQTYNGQNPPFTVQLKLQSSGRVEVLLDSRVDNRGSSFDLDAVVGMGAGTPGVLPAASNLSAGVSTSDPTVFEQFTTTAPATPNPLFDLASRQLEFVPTGPGWNVTNEALPTIQAQGTEILPTPVDNWTAIQPIGFAFPFNGATYTDLYISDHGEIGLSNAGVPGIPAGSTFAVDSSALGTGGPRIAAYWSDANCNKANASAAGIFLDNTSGSHCTVTWRDSETYSNMRPPFSVQLTLHDDGHVTINLENRVANQGSSFDLDAVVGIGNGTASPLPAASDLSAGVVTADPSVYQQFTTTAPGTPNPLFDLSASTLNFYPQFPGWQVTTESLGCARENTYGSGCHGLSLDSNPPIIGSNWNLQTSGIDPISPLSIMFFGPAFVPGLPLPVIGLPAPGCSIYLSSVLANLTAPSVGGVSVTTVPIPVSPTLKGADLSAQSLSFTIANPSGVATSNGLTGVIGY